LNETLNPVWNQTFDFVVEDALHELLIFEVYDHDTIGKVTSSVLILDFTQYLFSALDLDLYILFKDIIILLLLVYGVLLMLPLRLMTPLER